MTTPAYADRPQSSAHDTHQRRWLAFGDGMLATGAIGILAGILESGFSKATPASLYDLFYGAGLHLLLALIITLVLRLILWRVSDRAFPWIAAGVFLALEVAVVPAYWLNVRAVLPPFTSVKGKLLTAVICAAGTIFAIALVISARHALGIRPSSRPLPRRHIPGVIGLLLAVLAAAAGGIFILKAMPHASRAPQRAEAATANRQNVIIILVDTLRRDHVGFFGYGRPTTPTIDGLLRDSYVFASAYTPSTWTIPSIASLFTGVAPTTHGIYGDTCALPQKVETLARTFQSYGYRTGAFVANTTISAINGYDQGFDVFFEHSLWWGWNDRTFIEGLAKRIARRSSDGSGGFGTVINDHFLKWVDRRGGDPLFAFLHYMDPHDPYQPPARCRDAVAPGAPPGPRMAPSFQDYPSPGDCGDWECIASPPTFSPDEIAGMIANYDGDVRHVDEVIGELLAGMRARGLLDNSHLLILNDHGEEFFDHRGWRHGRSIYQEICGGVMAYRPPGGLAGGRMVDRPAVIDRPVAMIDLPRTIAEKLGITLPDYHQGQPIPEILEGHPGRDLPVVCERPPYLYAMRQRNWMVIRRGAPDDPEWRLYDVSRDPQEHENLASLEPDTLAILRGTLEGLTFARKAAGFAGSRSPADPRAAERLRSLGYIK